MATADMEQKTEGEAEAEPTSPPGLAWDESVAFRPIGIGWDSEPVALDRPGGGPPALLVLAGGGRSARIFRPVGEGEFPRPYDAGVAVEGLEGLRCVCPIPNADGRFDL